MKKIQLGGHRYKNKPIRGYALVDDEDFEKLNQVQWHLSFKTGYPQNHDLGTMHTYLLPSKIGYQIDHRDRNPLNNQKSNLRYAFRFQNMFNSKKREGNLTSKYRGVFRVSYKPRLISQRWAAQINVKGKRYHIGNFDTEIQAALAYDLWADDIAGEFANTNFKGVISSKKSGNLVLSGR